MLEGEKTVANEIQAEVPEERSGDREPGIAKHGWLSRQTWVCLISSVFMVVVFHVTRALC